MQTIAITTAAEFEALKQTTPRLLADFWKENCVNCKMLELAFQKLVQTSPEILAPTTLAKLKLEDLGESLFLAHNIRQAPTLVLYQGARENARLSGFIPPEKIASLLSS
ncbi:thioredoxin family protein [Termitidicoccus mucosus]|uniref:Thioredoxin n=1 Tax=Termitidicoccus mucosus TaxID=1184151 RepID=A0A178IBE0_9BACT|nr:thioredoxin [Opitutaceae bacterium TSB47]